MRIAYIMLYFCLSISMQHTLESHQKNILLQLEPCAIIYGNNPQANHHRKTYLNCVINNLKHAKSNVLKVIACTETIKKKEKIIIHINNVIKVASMCKEMMKKLMHYSQYTIMKQLDIIDTFIIEKYPVCQNKIKQLINELDTPAANSNDAYFYNH